MVTSSSCRASQFHISGKVHNRIAMNYLVKLHQKRYLLLSYNVDQLSPVSLSEYGLSKYRTSGKTLDGFNTVNAFDKYAFQTWQAYSKMGRTKTLKAVFIATKSLDPNVFLIRPNNRFALPTIQLIWESHFSEDSIQMPKCL